MMLPDYAQRQQRPREAGVEVIKCLARHNDHKPSELEVQRRVDDERERRIDLLRIELLAAITTDERHSLWNRLKDEINARSPAQVARMERACGLRQEKW